MALALGSKRLSNGSHTLIAQAYDAASNIGSSDTVTFGIGSATPYALTIQW